MILSKWRQNFPLEFKTEIKKINDESDPFSPVQSDLFSSFKTDFFSKFSSKEKLREQEDNELFEEDEDYDKPDILKWDVSTVANQITLILSKKNFFFFFF